MSEFQIIKAKHVMASDKLFSQQKPDGYKITQISIPRDAGDWFIISCGTSYEWFGSSESEIEIIKRDIV